MEKSTYLKWSGLDFTRHLKLYRDRLTLSNAQKRFGLGSVKGSEGSVRFDLTSFELSDRYYLSGQVPFITTYH